jgi:hypothetical protein
MFLIPDCRWGDPGPCPVDDTPHTACTSPGYAPGPLVSPLGNRDQRVVMTVVPPTGTGKPAGQARAGTDTARQAGPDSASSAFTTKTYSRARHGRFVR